MMPRSNVLAAVVVIGLVAGVALLLWQRPAPPAATLAAPANGSSAAVASTEPPATSPSATSSPSLPAAGDTTSPDPLRQRALAGDGKAAAQWQDLDLTCRRIRLRPQPLQLDEYFSAQQPSPSQPPLPGIPPQDHQLLLDQSLDLQQRKELAAHIAERLRLQCRDYQPASAAERYAVAAVAARRGPKAALWTFVQQPPFLAADGSVEDAEVQRRWTREVQPLLEEHALRSDEDAVFALGLAQLPDGDAQRAPQLPPNQLLNAALADDAGQAYRWLSLYVHMHPPSQLVDQAQTWLSQLDKTLAPDERNAAAQWASDYRQRQAADAAQN